MIEVKNNTQEMNLTRVYQALIPIEKLKLTSKINSKCVHKVSTKIIMRKLNYTENFVDEVETQLREKPLWGSQTQDIHYLEDKARYKIVTLTYT